MIDNKDYEYMKQKFDDDGLRAPESLGEDAIRGLLAAKTGAETAEEASRPAAERASARPASSRTASDRPARRRWMRPVIALAACAALVLGVFPLMKDILPQSEEPAELVASESGTVTAAGGDLQQFGSYKELDRTIREMIPKEQTDFYIADEELALSEDAADAEADAAMPNAATGGTAEADSGGGETAKGADEFHSSTYTQVEGVDEADVVKTDGKYIYYVSDSENQIIIASAKDGKTKRVSAINAGKAASYIHDLYIKDNQLILISAAERYDSQDEAKMPRTSTAVTVYDITDRANPKQTDQYFQTGSLLSSRLIRDTVCLVTNDYIYGYDPGANQPFVCYGEGDAERLPISDISCIPDTSNPAFTVVGTLDLSTGKVSSDTVRTKAVLGGSGEIYCSGDNLYIAATVSGSGAETFYTTSSMRTRVLKVSLASGKVKFRSTVTVNGMLNDQFSMDESNGTFKIATTSEYEGQDVNNLYILDEGMKEIGSVLGFARDEHIEAVRYFKDKAYVITYEQTDPLFIIDLADPSNPVIEGHVKITGFSSLLVPSGTDYLLGIGYSTETSEFGEATNGLKLALFDIRNPSKPSVADSKSFFGWYSDVQYNHKALLVGPQAAWYAIPFERYSDLDAQDVIIEDADAPFDTDVDTGETDTVESDPASLSGPDQGILLFSAASGKLKVIDRFATADPVKRCVCIGNYIYGICRDDSIESFER